MIPRYRLRTLLIAFAIAPAVLWLAWLGGVQAMVVYLSTLAICIPAFIAGLVVGWLIDLRPRKVRDVMVRDMAEKRKKAK